MGRMGATGSLARLDQPGPQVQQGPVATTAMTALQEQTASTGRMEFLARQGLLGQPVQQAPQEMMARKARSAFLVVTVPMAMMAFQARPEQ